MKRIFLHKVVAILACVTACGWSGIANGQTVGQSSMGPHAYAYTRWSVRYTIVLNVVLHDIECQINPILAEAQAEKKGGDYASVIHTYRRAIRRLLTMDTSEYQEMLNQVHSEEPDLAPTTSTRNNVHTVYSVADQVHFDTMQDLHRDISVETQSIHREMGEYSTATGHYREALSYLLPLVTKSNPLNFIPLGTADNIALCMAAVNLGKYDLARRVFSADDDLYYGDEKHIKPFVELQTDKGVAAMTYLAACIEIQNEYIPSQPNMDKARLACKYAATAYCHRTC
jgi:tetratricopeptide (TPR) repeat protein